MFALLQASELQAISTDTNFLSEFRSELDSAGFIDNKLQIEYFSTFRWLAPGLDSAHPRLDPIIRSFVVGTKVRLEEFEPTFSASTIDSLLKHRLLCRVGGGVIATFRLTLFDGLLIVGDPPLLLAEEEWIISPEESTHWVASYLVNSLAENQKNLRVLDVGTGTGAIALSAAARGHHVLGVDIHSRAVALAEVNASLNKRSATFELCSGKPEEYSFNTTFDRITFNAPGLSECGQTALSMCTGILNLPERFVSSLPALLSENGVCFFRHELPTRDRDRFDAAIKELGLSSATITDRAHWAGIPELETGLSIIRKSADKPSAILVPMLNGEDPETYIRSHEAIENGSWMTCHLRLYDHISIYEPVANTANTAVAVSRLNPRRSEFLTSEETELVRRTSSETVSELIGEGYPAESIKSLIVRGVVHVSSDVTSQKSAPGP